MGKKLLVERRFLFEIKNIVYVVVIRSILFFLYLLFQSADDLYEESLALSRVILEKSEIYILENVI